MQTKEPVEPGRKRFTRGIVPALMSGRDEASAPEGASHRQAAAAFARRVRRQVDGIKTLTLFGSTARDDASGLSSDVDFLAVVTDDAACAGVEERLRDIAYDVMVEHGPVVEVHVLPASEFERRRDHPFFRRALREGEVYA